MVENCGEGRWKRPGDPVVEVWAVRRSLGIAGVVYTWFLFGVSVGVRDGVRLVAPWRSCEDTLRRV